MRSRSALEPSSSCFARIIPGCQRLGNFVGAEHIAYTPTMRKIVVLLLALSPLTAAAGSIIGFTFYRWKDSNGNVVLSTVPKSCFSGNRLRADCDTSRWDRATALYNLQTAERLRRAEAERAAKYAEGLRRYRDALRERLRSLRNERDAYLIANSPVPSKLMLQIRAAEDAISELR